jgi:hypothetical protein
MNGVTGAPVAMISILRRSARHDTPRLGSALDTVPLPRIVPAVNRRVRAMWAIRSKNENCISPVSTSPTCAPFQRTERRRWRRPPRQAVPSSSGVTANGENAVAGFDWKKPKPFASSAGTRLRWVTSFARQRSRTWRSASSAAAPRGTSPSTTQTSASKSMPHAGSGSGMSSQGASSTPEPPW